MSAPLRLRHPSLAEPTGPELAAMLREARAVTLRLTGDLDDEPLRVPRLPIVNPPRWELGHVAWFQEKWNLRHQAQRPPLRPDGDLLFDSAAIAHDRRFELAVPSRDAVLDYLRQVLEATCERLTPRMATGADRYFAQLALFHEDMHGEALAYTRQTLALPPPAPPPADDGASAPEPDGGPLEGDAEVPGGRFLVGASAGAFVFDNEKWAHPAAVAPFRIARAPVTQAEFAEFVEAGGYRRRESWSDAGWAWLTSTRAERPVYWERAAGGGWMRRRHDRLVALEPHRPMVHVNWFEADAWCRWRGRRLPTEAEWEIAASGERGADGARTGTRRLFPWGDEPPDRERAHLGRPDGDTIDVGARPDGDSAFGCRQLLGNVWEWTASDFGPYPGFVADPYTEYSAPWFGDHKILRGGCFVTQPRLLRNTLRNFYTPDRRDVWAGFRTCAL